jgi:valyl-tRNA synthetase
VTKGLESYNFDSATLAIYNFFWDDFCDWYIEISKQRIGEDCVQSILFEVLDASLRLLHPFMPFVTEELWQRLPHQGESISLAPWPDEERYPLDEEVEEKVRFLQEVVKQTRNMRKVLGFAHRAKPELLLYYNEVEAPLFDKKEKEIIKTLCTLSDVKVLSRLPAKGRYMRSRVGNVDLLLEVKKTAKIEEEIERTRKELEAIEKELEKVEKKLQDEVFRLRAPKAILEKQEAIRRELSEKKEILFERLSLLSDFE